MADRRTASDDGRSAMARASDARPPRYYDPARGREEPAAVTAARERHRAVSEEIERARALAAAGTGREGGAMAKAQPAGLHGDGRSPMARASDALPFRPYVYKGTGEDIYKGARGYLDDVRRQAAARHEESAPDIGRGPEWYRELADGDTAPPAPVLAPVPVPALALPAAGPDGDELAEPDAARGRYQAALAGVPEPAPAPPPVTTTARCGRCGYLTAAAGHRVTCGD